MTSGGGYDNYWKAQQFDTKSANYQSASAAIQKALKDGGYSQDWYNPVMELVARESSFDANNKNPGSSAAGLFQFLDSTRKNYGGSSVDWSDPYQQAIQGLKYIKGRYTTPVKALQHWDEKKWY